MRVKSENGVVFAGETTNVNSFCGFLASSSWSVQFKSADESEHDEKKAKKTKKAVSSFSPFRV